MTRLRLAIGPDDHRLGPPDAPVTLVEYGDFECPFCGRAYWEVKRLCEALGDRLCFVFRHFPLRQLHPNAVLAAEAAEAASAQGRFWEMHAQLFEHQQALGFEDLVRYAEELSLDLARFISDLDQRRFAERIRAEFLSGARSGVESTPTFFVNGERHDGPARFDALLAALEGGTPAPAF